MKVQLVQDQLFTSPVSHSSPRMTSARIQPSGPAPAGVRNPGTNWTGRGQIRRSVRATTVSASSKRPAAQAREAPPASLPRKRASRRRRSDQGTAVESFLAPAHLQTQPLPRSLRGPRRPVSGPTTDRLAPSRGHRLCVAPRPRSGRPGSTAPGSWRSLRPARSPGTRPGRSPVRSGSWSCACFLLFSCLRLRGERCSTEQGL